MVGTIISTSTSTGITLSSGDSPVSVTGTIVVTYGNALYGPSGGGANSWVIDNAGSLAGGDDFAPGNGIRLGSVYDPVVSGAITNESGGVLAGTDWGVYVSGPGSVTNLAGGTITGIHSFFPTGGGVRMAGAPGAVVNSGTITGYSYGVVEAAGGTIINNIGGTITGAGSGVLLRGGAATVTNAGTISGGYASIRFYQNDPDNRVIVNPGATFVGRVLGGNGTMELAAGKGTIASFGTDIFNFTTLAFDPDAQWTVLGDALPNDLASMAITGFAAGDTIDLTGVVADAGTYSDGELVLTNSAVPVATLHMAGVFTTKDFGITNNGSDTTITTDVACYRAGTRILTPSGEVPIEDLAIGDPVVTRSGEAKPIKWIGRRSYAGRFIAGSRDVLPIRIAANALADGVPSRDLDVSSKHAMFIDGVLVPAELLVNGVSICRLSDVESVEYVHLELASHDVILAEGAASETFVDCDSRAMFHNAADYASRYPDDPGPAWQFCAPRAAPASAELAAIRDRLARRAGSPEDFGPPTALRGNIELCDRTRMCGWVFDRTQPDQRVRLEIRCDGELIGHVLADRYRADLEAAGFLGDGRCSFNFIHPIQLSPLSDHVIELLRAVDGTPVPGSPLRLPAASTFDAESRTAVTRLLSETAQAATKAADLDEIIVHQMTQVETLIAARARLDAGAHADVANLHDRWAGLVPTPAIRRAAPKLRPQALFIDETVPAMGVSGGSNAAIDHMRALMRIGFDVDFVASQDLGDRLGRARALAALGIRPLVAPWYGSVEEVLRRHCGRLDVVYLHRVGSAAAYGKLVRQYCPRAQLVYGVADLHHLRLARQGALENRPDISRDAARLRIDELMAARMAHVVITHSNAEAALLRAQLPRVPVALVPWSVPVRQSGTGFADRNGVVFVGHFAHAPNVDAVQWLAQEILPCVLQQDPSIQFRVVGNAMPEALRQVARPGLELVGPVERLDAVFDAARLTVAPLRYGAGIKAKVIESLGAGVPCVGTSIAFEGMTLPSALAGCVADTPEALAAALVRHYHDEAAHTHAAEAGQDYARTNNSEACVDALMRRALAPALRRWAGVAEEHGDEAPAIRMAG